MRSVRSGAELSRTRFVFLQVKFDNGVTGMSKQKNIKIKRSKGRLYKKKKSTARKVIETLALIVIVGGLVFVGYSAAGPLISHLSGGSETDSGVSMWTPDEGTLNSGTNTDNTSGEELTETEKNSVSSGIGSYLLPEAALKSSSALNSSLSAAKNSGFNIVLIPVKNTEGYLLYSSSISYVKDTELIGGTMSASQIAQAAKSMGLIPKAVLPALLDSKSSSYVGDMSYTFANGGTIWHDADPGRGGKRWNDPFKDGTKKYYTDLSKELTGAGFEEVILSELRYPSFSMGYDDKYLEAKYFSADRYKALTTLYNSVFSASDKKASVSVNAKDVLDGYGKSYGSTAEILTDKSFAGTIYLVVNLSDFDTELKTGDSTSIKLSPEPVKKSEALINKAMEYIGTNVTVVPVIRSEGLSAEALVNCYKNLMAE